MEGKITTAEKGVDDAETALDVHAEGLKTAIKDNGFILKIA